MSPTVAVAVGIVAIVVVVVVVVAVVLAAIGRRQSPWTSSPSPSVITVGRYSRPSVVTVGRRSSIIGRRQHRGYYRL